MSKRPQTGKRARVNNSPGRRDSPAREFLKWLAGMVAEKLNAKAAIKKSPKDRK